MVYLKIRWVFNLNAECPDCPAGLQPRSKANSTTLVVLQDERKKEGEKERGDEEEKKGGWRRKSRGEEQQEETGKVEEMEEKTEQ